MASELKLELERLSHRSKKLKITLKQLKQSKEKINKEMIQQQVQLYQLTEEIKTNELNSEQLNIELELHLQELDSINQSKVKIVKENKKRKKRQMRDKIHELFSKYVNDPNRSFDEERVIDLSIPDGKTHYLYEWKGVKIEHLGYLTFRSDNYDVFFKTTVFVDEKLVAKIEH